MRSKIILLFAATVLFMACSRKKSIQVAGSTTVLPVASKSAEKYKEQHSDYNIIVNAGGSGVGVNQLGEGKLDIGMISRHVTDEEKQKYPNVDFNTIPIGRDAVVPVVSSEIYDAGITALTLDQMGKIYQGKIKNWKALDGPDKEILCVDKEASRGTRHVFMQAVLHDEEAEAPGADLVLGANNEEQTAIIQSDAAIGMLSNAWLNKDVKGLKVIMPDGNEIAPTPENIREEKFPIMRNLSFITNGEPKGAVKDYIDFVLSEAGQEIVQESGYVRIKN